MVVNTPRSANSSSIEYNSAGKRKQQNHTGTTKTDPTKAQFCQAMMADYPDNVDIMIPIMGRTGVGKSRFINEILTDEYGQNLDPKTLMKVGETLRGCTMEVKEASLRQDTNGRRIILVDTPGYDGRPYDENHNFLETVANWFKGIYKKQGVVLAGIIYLHDISQDRFSSDDYHNLEIFQSLCGSRAFNRIVIWTTKWDKVSNDLKYAIKRQEELLSQWKPLIDQGVQVHPHNEIPAKGIGDLVLKGVLRGSVSSAVLQIQVQMVDKVFWETAAAKHYIARQIVQIDTELLNLKDKRNRERLERGKAQLIKLIKSIPTKSSLTFTQRIRRLFKL